ncbi:hypothetical protein [Streptomyces cacaoi]|uniref:hypothetical protein n=1 Tax=Streptomyces cacaoi TaxID=1898 RepID=UPI0011F0A074|nr:hypothetical protein [Streptomyces cacaoi]
MSAAPPAASRRLAALAQELMAFWDEHEYVVFPGWPLPFRPLEELLPQRDVDFALRNPQMVPLLWYPAIRPPTAPEGVVEVLDHLPGWAAPAPSMLRRQYLSRIYSWALASRTAVDWAVRSLDGRKLVEVGAGTGYWASLLADRGLDVLATDQHVHRNGYADMFRFAAVQPLDAPTAAARHPDRVLGLWWPPRDDPMAVDTLRAYRGEHLLYVGDARGGQCADAAFFDELESGWHPVSSCPLTLRWLGNSDGATLYRRGRGLGAGAVDAGPARPTGR